MISQPVARRIGSHRSTGLAMLLMAVGYRLGEPARAHASYLDLMPSFVLIGIGGGLSVPLTDMVLGAMPTGSGRRGLGHLQRLA